MNPSCNFIARPSEETDDSSVYIREEGDVGGRDNISNDGEP